MKEIVSAVNQAEDFVMNAEDAWARTLFVDMKEAEHRAESCGCPNCRKHASGLQDVWGTEANRLYGSDFFPDHEEEWIADQALIVLYKRKPDLKDI